MKKKTVVLGVTGGIACYKSAALASKLTQAGYDVEVVLTKNATEFIGPHTFESLTHNRAMVDTFDRNFQSHVEHVALADKADLLLIAPATANILAKAAHGIADDMLSTTIPFFWSPGNDGVRVTVVDAQSGSAVSTPVDFSNRSQSATMLHFGKVSKIQYRDGASLSLQSGVPYNCLQPAYSMPAIINSNSRPASIEAIKRYFCSEYACMMVADATGVSYENMLAGQYKILLEPIAYVTFNGTKYAFTATEAALYDQLSGGSLRSKLPTVAFQNLPLALFLEYSDLGFPAWTGGRRGIQSNGDIWC